MTWQEFESWLRSGEARPPLVMGVLNVTPDSFSEAGKYADHAAAIAHARQMAADGAHLIDIGGESTRPGAERVPAEEQIRRIVPVIRALRDLPGGAGTLLSVDTTRAA